MDLDLFVRGLTHFHYRYIKERRNITKDLSVSDYFELTNADRKSSDLARERFFEIDLMPAVSQIEEQIDYLEIADHTVEKLKRFLLELRSIGQSYDYVIIDNRAGVDELVIETSKFADISIAVSESDAISRSTNENLLRHLASKESGKVYTIINKVRHISTMGDYENSMKSFTGDFSILGQIPFDIELFEAFGTVEFWDKVNSTVYAYGLSECWNRMADRESFSTQITMKRFSTGIFGKSTKRPSYLGRLDRMSILFGIACIGAYFGYDLFINKNFQIKDIFLIYAGILVSWPFARRFLKRDED